MSSSLLPAAKSPELRAAILTRGPVLGTPNRAARRAMLAEARREIKHRATMPRRQRDTFSAKLQRVAAHRSVGIALARVGLGTMAAASSVAVFIMATLPTREPVAA